MARYAPILLLSTPSVCEAFFSCAEAAESAPIPMKQASSTPKIGLKVLRKMCVNVSSQKMVKFPRPQFLERLFSQVLTREARNSRISEKCCLQKGPSEQLSAQDSCSFSRPRPGRIVAC